MCKPLLFLLISALFAFSCNKVISSSLSSSDISETTPREESTPVTLPVINLSINAAVSEIEVGHSLTLIANVTGSAFLIAAPSQESNSQSQHRGDKR